LPRGDTRDARAHSRPPVLEPLLHRWPAASTAASFLVRTGNTFIGSLLWVDFLRLCGLQKVKAAAAAPPPPPPAAGKDKKRR